MTTVYTAVFGGHDNLVAPEAQYVDADWICVTDDPTLIPPAPWRAVLLTPDHPAMAYPHPRMRTVWAKCLPWQFTDDDTTVWIDASHQVTSPDFLGEAIAAAPSGFATYAHPDRDCIYDEAEASHRLQPAKYHGLPLVAQVEHYRTLGHPEHWGLYAVGTIVRDCTSELVRTLGVLWLAECERWTYQTQLSLPHVCRQLDFAPDTFDHHQRRSPWLRIGQHLTDL